MSQQPAPFGADVQVRGQPAIVRAHPMIFVCGAWGRNSTAGTETLGSVTAALLVDRGRKKYKDE